MRWVGVATREYRPMFEFLQGVLGLEVAFEEETTAEFATSDGDTVQIMAPGDRTFELFSRNATGPVPLFEVDDVHAAAEELERAGVELVGAPGQDENWEWINFRAPDGNLYELAARRRVPGCGW
ncbi:VOC family protein [Kribbella capetownensis]|uniref:VOC family protein n=1 Tax=Kribbella capetownensis TaxID=1572659 RepID=A0A4R0J9E4_9ACTN|nr:VOC family protein [Kribbella capetownensis]TCC42809.1 VOC family protein [Kribbella capetownensis]